MGCVPRKFTGRKSIKNNMFLSIMAALVITIIIFGMLTYWSSSRIILEQTNRVYIDLLNQTQNSVESRLDEIDALALTLAKSTWVNTISFMQGSDIDQERIDRYKLVEYSRVFGSFKTLNSLIYKTGLIFCDKNTVITPDGTESIDWFFSHSFQFENFSREELNTMLNNDTNQKYVYLSDINFYGNKYRCLVLIRKIPLLHGADNVKLIVAIKLTTLQDLLQKDRMNGIASYIIDENKQILTDVNGNPSFENVLKTSIEEEKIISVYPDNNKYYIFSSKSDNTGWTYAILVPEKTLLGRINDIRDITLYICVFLLAAGIFMSYLMAKRSYKPFKSLYDNVLERTGGLFGETMKTDLNEIELLQKAFENMAINGENMERRMDECIPFAMHSFFIKLLHGMIKTEEIPLLKELMNIDSDLKYWTVAILLYNAELKANNLDKKLIVWNSGMEWTVYLVQLEKNKLALITNTTGRSTSTDIIKNSLDSIFTCSAKEEVVIGVGRTYESIGDLSNSYMDANIAIEYIHYSTMMDKCIVFFEDIEKENRINYYYPIEKEEILINYLRTGNIEKAKSTLNELLQENLNCLKLSQFSLKCLFYNLISTALKVLQLDNLMNIEIIADDNLMTLLSVDDMKAYIEEIYSKICLEIQNRKANANNGSIRNILRFIDENYTDPNISLTSVAIHFNITVPYLSRYFKEQTNYNFIEYINKKRIEKAKKLMSESSMTLEKICSITGYNNILTFRRAFKKLEGVVPSEYRGFTGMDAETAK